MSFIACTQSCIYQSEGQCKLSRSTSLGTTIPNLNGCVHYIPLATSNQCSQRLSNISDPNQFQSIRNY